jgi:GNAT superfamily N-acetyltransferase
MATLREAATQDQLDGVRGLMTAFVAWHRQRHAEDLDLINRYFDPAAFAEELAHLPGKYGPPGGRLLLASHGDRPVGCVALRDLGECRCEMKRMFVDPEFHGRGVGRGLAEAVITAARAIGYTTMRLDTSIRQTEALNLYASLGFRTIEPYYPLPAAMAAWLVFMELNL